MKCLLVASLLALFFAEQLLVLIEHCLECVLVVAVATVVAIVAVADVAVAVVLVVVLPLAVHLPFACPCCCCCLLWHFSNLAITAQSQAAAQLPSVVEMPVVPQSQLSGHIPMPGEVLVFQREASHL